MKTLFLLTFLSFTVCFSQNQDSLKLKIDYGVASEEFQDYLLMKNIDFYKVNISNKNLKGKTFTLVSKEYWNKELTKTVKEFLGVQNENGN